MSFSRKSPWFCRFNLFLCFVKIVFAWLRPASTIYEVGNADKNGVAADRRLGYLVALLILLQYLRFLLLSNILASRSTCTSISISSMSHS